MAASYKLLAATLVNLVFIVDEKRAWKRISCQGVRKETYFNKRWWELQSWLHVSPLNTQKHRI